MVTIHVLAGGELFQHVLNAISAFMKQDDFLGLIRITALVGIVMATAGFLKSRDPLVFGRWFLGYVLMINLVLLPKTTVVINDISSQKPKLVDNVPVVFALSASLVTTIGYGLAESYDALLSLPDDLQYTKTGALFGSRLILASTDFRITDAVLKEEMDQYFRACVVGDIRLNHKYSVGDLTHSTNLWDLITKQASPLRMTRVNGQLVTCHDAAKPEGQRSLRKKLEAEIKKAYAFFGIPLFGKAELTTYEQLFATHLTSAFTYYQGLTDESSNLFLQSMMINAIGDGTAHYQAFTDATAGIVNQQFTKSQVQHRWSWEIAGLKALWFLPLLHTWLTLLLFGVFPLIIVLATLPEGTRILFGALQFFLSLQFWPVKFAILNAGMALYGSQQSGQYGQFTMVNIDKIDELHKDISGVAGYMMMLIPFLANGLVSNLGAAFSNLATSMTGHVQGSTMTVAGEAASASFGLGQTSFYNTTANNVSANKHDSNWTHLHGMHTEQLGSGVLKTLSGDGSTIFDVSPGMSKNAVSINASEGLSASLNQAFEDSKQVAINESTQYQTSLSQFAHRAVQLSQLQGHELRLGDGVSQSESGQFSDALSTMTNIAKDVAHRTGTSTEDALTHLTSGGWGTHAGIRSDHSLPGKLAQYLTGVSGGADAHLKFDRSSNSSHRVNEGFDETVSAREAQDFNHAFNYVNQFTQSHHFDESESKAASLSQQMGSDLRQALTASRNYDASLAKTERISQAKSYVQSHAEQITTNLDQAFPAYVAEHLGQSARDDLFAHPGDLKSLEKQQALAQDFIAGKRDELVAQFGHGASTQQVESFYHEQANQLGAHEGQLQGVYQTTSEHLANKANELQLGVDAQKINALQASTRNKIDALANKTVMERELLKEEQTANLASTKQEISLGKYEAKNGVIPYHAVDNTLENLHLKEKE